MNLLKCFKKVLNRIKNKKKKPIKKTHNLKK